MHLKSTLYLFDVVGTKHFSIDANNLRCDFDKSHVFIVNALSSTFFDFNFITDTQYLRRPKSQGVISLLKITAVENTHFMLRWSGDDCHVIVASVQLRRDLISSTNVWFGKVGIDRNLSFAVAITLKFTAGKRNNSVLFFLFFLVAKIMLKLRSPFCMMSSGFDGKTFNKNRSFCVVLLNRSIIGPSISVREINFFWLNIFTLIT